VSTDVLDTGRTGARVQLSPRFPDASLGFLRWLREATAAGRHPVWSGSVGADVEIELLYHLVPPQSLNHPGDAARWRDAFRPGLCHYRKGLGFLTVYDARSGSAVREVVDHPDELAVFELYRDPCQLPERGRPLYDAVARLARRRLLLPMGRWGLILPYRATRVSIPLRFI
jgi:hypothetical protein